MKMFMDNRGRVGVVVDDGEMSVPIWLPIILISLVVAMTFAFWLEPYFTGIDCPNCGEKVELIGSCNDYDCHYVGMDCGGGGKSYKCWNCGNFYHQ